jgi:hypothetical protein
MITPRAVLYLVAISTVFSGPTDEPTFREVSRSSGIKHVCYDQHRICGGVAFFDYNNDGYQDIYLTGGGDRDRLYENRGDGRFRDVSKKAGLTFTKDVVTVGVATGDIDNDGDRDVFVTTYYGYRNLLLENDGNGRFTDIAEAAGIVDTMWSTAVAFGDYDLDGFLDLHVGNYATYDGLPYDENLTGGIENQLYRNRGDRTFEDVAAALGVSNPGGLTLATTFTDFDGDGDLDIYVVNDFGELFEPNALLRNEYPQKRFTDVSAASRTDMEMNGMGIATGDFNEDGALDYYLTNMEHNILYENVGSGMFRDMGMAHGLEDSLSTSWGAVFLDYDHDTYLDLLIANGRVLPRYRVDDPRHLFRLLHRHENRLFRNDGGGRFHEISQAVGIADTTRGRGLAVADYDNDGDLDFVVAVVSKEKKTKAHALLYRNEGGNAKNWLKVQVEGTGSNRDGFGSRVRVAAAGRRWIREIDGGSSYVSQSSNVAHFGLDNISQVDSVIVVWPGGGLDIITGVTVNQTVHVVEASSRGANSVEGDP